MTISITIPGVTFTKYVGKVLLPYMEDAICYNLYGTDAASSILNRKVGSTVNASVVGAPTYGAGYALCRNVNNGFDLGFILREPYTQVIVAKRIAGADLALFGRGNGNADNFADMLKATTTAVTCWPGQVATMAVAGEIASSFFLVGARWALGGKDGVFRHDGTSLAVSNNSVNNSTVYTPTHNLRVGAAWYDDTGYFQVAASVVYGRVMTDAEIVQVHDYLKPLVAARGVTMA